MADDVASFFKSKKSKKHGPGQRGHGANVQTPDALARRLERTVQQQQLFDRENGVEENEDEFEAPRPVYSQQLSGGGGAGPGVGGGGGGEQNNVSLDSNLFVVGDVSHFGSCSWVKPVAFHCQCKQAISPSSQPAHNFLDFQEESEWLDIQEQQDIDIEKIGIKELEIREESDAEANEDEESLGGRKTWNIPGQQQEKQQQAKQSK